MRRRTWISEGISEGIVAGALAMGILVAAGPALAQDATAAAMAADGMGSMDSMEQGTAIPWEKQIDTFFEKVAAGQPAEAIDSLYTDNPWSESLGDQLAGLREQFTGLSDVVGAYIGNDRLAVRPLSDRFVYVWHLGYYERQPLQFHFAFYKPKDRWLLFQFSYEEGVAGLAKELAKDELAGVSH